jgi:hypothetical protein
MTAVVVGLPGLNSQLRVIEVVVLKRTRNGEDDRELVGARNPRRCRVVSSVAIWLWYFRNLGTPCVPHPICIAPLLSTGARRRSLLLSSSVVEGGNHVWSECLGLKSKVQKYSGRHQTDGL